MYIIGSYLHTFKIMDYLGVDMISQVHDRRLHRREHKMTFNSI